MRALNPRNKFPIVILAGNVHHKLSGTSLEFSTTVIHGTWPEKNMMMARVNSGTKTREFATDKRPTVKWTYTSAVSCLFCGGKRCCIRCNWCQKEEESLCFVLACNCFKVPSSRIVVSDIYFLTLILNIEHWTHIKETLNFWIN